MSSESTTVNTNAPGANLALISLLQALAAGQKSQTISVKHPSPLPTAPGPPPVPVSNLNSGPSSSASAVTMSTTVSRLAQAAQYYLEAPTRVRTASGSEAFAFASRSLSSMGDRDVPASYIPVAAPTQPESQDLLNYGLNSGCVWSSRPFRPSPDRDLLAEPSNVLVVLDLDRGIKESSLRSAFDQYGTVYDVTIIINPITGISRGFGFVTMRSILEARRCIQYLHGIPLRGRGHPIRVDYSFTKYPHRPTPGKYLGLRRQD